MVYVPVEFDKTLDTLTYCCGLPFRCSICKKGLEMIFITIEDPIEE